MAGYERVNAHDDEDGSITPIATESNTTYHVSTTPNSPPPSFRSRASSPQSRERRNRIEDATLADAFDADGDDSDEEEADDRQRLVRGNTLHIRTPDEGQTPENGGASSAQQSRSSGPERQVTQLPRGSSAATASQRTMGGGGQADGVFSNLSAKPERGGVEKHEQPPTYEQAAADAAPPYWETTILAPGMGGPDDVFVDGMPVGSVFSFAWNGMITVSFSVMLIGFLLTYLLHSTHAAKNGSRAGLGIILIQYGFQLKSAVDDPVTGSGSESSDASMANPPDPNAHNFDPSTVTGGSGGGFAAIAESDWVSYLLMILGWFILIRSVTAYLKARKHEQLVLQSPDRGLPVPIIAEGESSEQVV